MSLEKKQMSIFDMMVIIILSVLGVLVVFPFYNVIIISFAKYSSIARAKLYIFPTSFQLDAYKELLKNLKFWRAFGNTVFITVVGTFVSMVISVSGAYALAKKDLPFRNFLLTLILITMFFGGGLIPYYLLMKNLGLINNMLVMIIPTAVTTMYVVIMKNYFLNAPQSLIESAKIDGAGDIYILIKIILPISKPFLATFALFYAVGRWNEWWNALMFINKSALAPLQIFLRDMLITYTQTLSIGAMLRLEANMNNAIYYPSLQMASVVVSSIPILLAYPYLQKHFTKGIMIGSIKE